MATSSLFFYGTLCHAAVLARVIGDPGEHLTTHDALLPHHARLHVDGEDYPAVVRAQDGARVLGRALTDDEASVRGVLVQGLTADDVALLDEFEGDVRPLVRPCHHPVHPLTHPRGAGVHSRTVHRRPPPLLLLLLLRRRHPPLSHLGLGLPVDRPALAPLALDLAL
ncbi:uncharacterized protein RHOBADRAFT_38805 [Rhodotorula graminis WP1]|uniref:Putative gamma-glutamylcyclotransferase n=1 Tax=Rhodotorula graminis (strain WP1) TaxID=578459 RepID=A0A0P9GJI7_RHOGW|nr:uncharacterized protein RHOBADRAFT_38805 [Rhodotorula graminis WP1]KPV73184.1 hypothetical protein RHOBADRAFT_38805 [Rhodotorula graminis WP1]